MATPMSSAAPSLPPGGSHLTPPMLEELRRLLDGELAERRAALAQHAAEELEPGDERELADARAEQHVEAIGDLEAALARLATGTYGSCERCATAIPFERLEAMPAARRCVACPELGTTALFG